MSYNNKLVAYQENRVASSSPEQLVALLYEHLLVSLKRAAKQIQAREVEEKARSVEKATSILHELLASLDFETGGEIAPRLASLYSFFLREVAEASRSLDAARLEPLIEMVASLHESWLEAVRTVALGSQVNAGPSPVNARKGMG
jgi:flagellar secretion chaperone FliS